jgi:DNA mismatch repair protein MutL
VTGYVGKPQFAKKKRGEQFLFVNKRFIKSNYLHHAIMKSFEGLLQEDSFPFYVLFIDIDPKHIDVNVHPTKTEIKFDDEKAVYAVILSSVRQSIGSHNLNQAIDFNADVNIISKLTQAAASSKDVYFDERFSTALHKNNRDNWEKLFEGGSTSRLITPEKEVPVQTLRFESAMNQSDGVLPEEKTLIQLHNRYVIKQVRAGMMIVDQQAAHERILFEKFLNQLKNKTGQSQQSLFPQTVQLNPADFVLAIEMHQEISALGFRFEEFGKNTLVINGLPSTLALGREKEIFEGLIEQFKINQSEFSISLHENLARSLARRASLKAGQRLSREEMQSLIDNLFACHTPNYAPDGRPSFFIFDLTKIESYFNRQ